MYYFGGIVGVLKFENSPKMSEQRHVCLGVCVYVCVAVSVSVL